MKQTPRRLRRASEKLNHLLIRAREEGEGNIHIIISHYPIGFKHDESFYGDYVKIDVRYFHGKVKREVTAYEVYSKSWYYNATTRVRDVADRIKKNGLEVMAVRSFNSNERIA